MKNTGLEEMHIYEYIKHLIVREKQYFSAKELTLYPGSRVTIRDRAAYGLMVI